MGSVFTCVDPAGWHGVSKPLNSSNMPSWLVMPFELDLIEEPKWWTEQP